MTRSHSQLLLDRVRAWCDAGGGTADQPAVDALLERIAAEALAPLAGAVERVGLPAVADLDARGRAASTPLCAAAVARKRADAPFRVLLNIHADTVHGPEASAVPVRVEGDRLIGPGVADARGGIAVMLGGLERFEAAATQRQKQRLGWTVVLNPDEEIGSPGSAGLLAEEARRHHAALLFEPSLPDGSLVGARGGSSRWSIGFRGRAAHAGRDFAAGRSAVHAACAAVAAMVELNDRPGCTFNCGAVDGGGPANAVADAAVLRLNTRAADRDAEAAAEAAVRGAAAAAAHRFGVEVEVLRVAHAPPRPAAGATATLLDAARDAVEAASGARPGLRETGGVCDGNRIAAAGCPVVDTLGVRGDHIHTGEEYLVIDSLQERADATARLLLRLADGGEALLNPRTAA
ncbi:hydrolase [Phycisphaera mikurensis]|uniref:Putative carboxypeptidase n=1 Tax=Phycisphaera mikurensis (strain NBRC 102666 / KCTC 22515 / FYK2301M01) TaxID=1142394 RepID=I0IF81_PHYMF|nr:hydrolase [Phycisphaera mikurensis]MBB6440685.1 glutamate carboxypeptidase [Phycisphaera mikurensis]BAM03919.1 putative carboxypeptidase [Phycisphaera mikurensis NBRC 102666]